jgi:hypothetical protein
LADFDRSHRLIRRWLRRPDGTQTDLAVVEGHRPETDCGQSAPVPGEDIGQLPLFVVGS